MKRTASYSLVFLLLVSFTKCSVDYEHAEEENNIYIGETTVVDSLNNEKRVFTEYFSKDDKKWFLNEDVFYDESDKIILSKSFYSDVKIKDKCLDIYLSNYYGRELESSVLILEAKNISDTIHNSEKPNNFKYCFPNKISGKVRLTLTAIFKNDSISKQLNTIYSFQEDIKLTSSIIKEIQFNN
jgi:hypothetical protein